MKKLPTKDWAAAMQLVGARVSQEEEVYAAAMLDATRELESIEDLYGLIDSLVAMVVSGHTRAAHWLGVTPQEVFETIAKGFALSLSEKNMEEGNYG